MINIIMILTSYETAVLGRPAKPVSYPAHIAGAVAGDGGNDDDYNDDDDGGGGDGDDDGDDEHHHGSGWGMAISWSLITTFPESE